MFARAIHEGGHRKNGRFVALNCGGLPRDILASELFGYVEGAFTGARRSGTIGKIEAAAGEPCSSTRSGKCRSSSNPTSFACSTGGKYIPSETASREKSGSGWWPPPTRTSVQK